MDNWYFILFIVSIVTSVETGGTLLIICIFFLVEFIANVDIQSWKCSHCKIVRQSCNNNCCYIAGMTILDILIQSSNHFLNLTLRALSKIFVSWKLIWDIYNGNIAHHSHADTSYFKMTCIDLVMNLNSNEDLSIVVVIVIVPRRLLWSSGGISFHNLLLFIIVRWIFSHYLIGAIYAPHNGC